MYIADGKNRKIKQLGDQSGVAIILALIMLLVMSVMGLTIAFYTNNDFFSMQNYKRGQEAFLAAERCVVEVRRRIENIGIEQLFFEVQSGVDNGFEIEIAEDGVDCDITPERCSICRTGPRNFVRTDPTDPVDEFIDIPKDIKTFGRPIKHVSLPSGGRGGATLFPISFFVTGKDRMDEDKFDIDTKVDTGVEIAGGIESFVPGGASNVY